MKPKLIAIYSMIALCSCVQPNTNKQTAKDSSNIIAQHEQSAAEKNYDDIGTPISTITIQQKASKEYQEKYHESTIDGISIEKGEAESANIIDGDAIVLSNMSVKLLIDYPLKKPATFELKTFNSKGFSRKELTAQICAKYHEIYDIEEQTANTKTVPSDKREGLYNRNETDGKYGIWGHDIADLYLTGIEIHRTKNGETILSLEVDS